MPQVGLYGKMPSVGDFVSRGFSPALCENLDAALQAALVALADEGGDARQVLEQARPVMIAIRPGALGASGFAGLWFPSRDRVGRVFPLCVGMEIDAGQAKVPLFWPSGALTTMLCSALVRVLQAGGGPDELLAALPSQGEWDGAAMHAIPFSSVGDETVPDVSYRGTLVVLRGPEESMSLAPRALCSRLPWVAQVLGAVIGPQGQAEWYFAARSIESWAPLAALFDGRWQQRDWAVTDAAGVAE
jgi:type VI secretion system ImpM family protein